MYPKLPKATQELIAKTLKVPSQMHLWLLAPHFSFPSQNKRIDGTVVVLPLSPLPDIGISGQ